MKKIHALFMLFIFLCVVISPAAAAKKAAKKKENAVASVAINETNFPDKIFRDFVSKNFDKNGDSQLSEEEINVIHDVEVGGMGISSLKGIENFNELNFIDCRDNQIQELNVEKFTNLDC